MKREIREEDSIFYYLDNRDERFSLIKNCHFDTVKIFNKINITDL